MICGGIKKGGLSKSEGDSYVVCAFGVKATQFCVLNVVCGSMVDVLE